MTDDTEATRNRELLATHTAWTQALADALPGETTVTVRQYPTMPSWHDRFQQAPTTYIVATIAVSTGSTLTLRWDVHKTAGFVQISSEYRIDGNDHDYYGDRVNLPAGIDPVAAAEIVDMTVLGRNRADAVFFTRLRAEKAGFADKRRAELAPLISTGVVAADENTLQLGWKTVLRSPDKDVKVTVSDTEDLVTVRLRYLTQQQAAALLTAYRAATAPQTPGLIAA